HLAKITDTDYRVLHTTVARRREDENYRLFAVKKRSGGRRFLHAPCGTLSIVQEFLNSEILQRISPHPAAFAFYPGGGIRECAQRHCDAKWLLHFDLKDFFHHVTEVEVFEIFKSLGYRPLLAFEMSRICTTTKLPRRLSKLCKFPKSYRDPDENFPYPVSRWGVLPQGASTSPMLSNLAARSLDDELSTYARSNGFVYTRYADDLTFSAARLPKGKSISRIRKEIVGLVVECGFVENKSKFRVSGPGSRKVVLGLLVDGERPRLTKATAKRIDRLLHAISKYGLVEVSRHERFDSAYGFYNHISGLIAYTKDVDVGRWEDFNGRFQKIPSPIS
ncbi:reverse transcriptase family protein, partial [Thiolapillus sp.]